MSQLACNCPHCGQELNVESEHAGQVVACPACSGEFTVPEIPAPVQPQAPALAPAPRLNVPSAPATRPPMQQAPSQHPQAPGPYRSPTSNLGGPQGYGAPPGGLSPHSVQLFALTKPWVTLFAALGSISPAALLLMGLLSAFFGVSTGAAGEGMSTGLLMISIGAIYFLPAWRLWQYSSAIGRLKISPSPQALDNAIDRQRCFWKTVGLITLIAFALGLVFMLIAMSLAGPSADDADLFLQ